MKRTKHRIALLSMLLCLALLLPFGGHAEGALQVTASFYPLYVAAINVCQDVPGASVSVMAPVSAGCLHDYQMTTADRKTLADTDVLLLNGAGLESFLDKVLPDLRAAVIDTSDGVTLITDDEGVNPHIWLSVDAMMRQVENIAAGLSEIDPSNADAYARNAADYIERLAALREGMHQLLDPLAGAKIVTFHEAFPYFARDFGLDVVATVETHHGQAPSAREMADLAVLLTGEGVKALFAEPQHADASVDILSRETGIPIHVLDPAVTGPVDPAARDAYIDAMRSNADTLVEALS